MPPHRTCGEATAPGCRDWSHGAARGTLHDPGSCRDEIRNFVATRQRFRSCMSSQMETRTTVVRGSLDLRSEHFGCLHDTAASFARN